MIFRHNDLLDGAGLDSNFILEIQFARDEARMMDLPDDLVL